MFTMAAVVQLVERPIVAWEVAGSSPVSRPVVSHGVDGRVRKPRTWTAWSGSGFSVAIARKSPSQHAGKASSRLGGRRDLSPLS